jgi:sortase A
MMKHRAAFNWVLGTISTVSFFIIIYVIYQLNVGEIAVEDSMKEWEKIVAAEELKKARQSIPMIDDIQVSPAVKKKELEMINVSEIKQGDIMGKITIPKIDKELPIIFGTSEDDLGRGVGHYIGTAYPGQNGNVVLSGHRDTVFERLDELQVGDTFDVETLEGNFTYQVYEGKIVESDDRTIIVPYSLPVLTLVTCYPFNFIGDAPQRYILTARLISST